MWPYNLPLPIPSDAVTDDGSRSRQPQCVPPPDPTTPDDRRINADVPSVLLDRDAEHVWIFGQAALAQRRHDAAGTGPVDLQQRVAERERPPDPAVLDEPVGAVRYFDHEVRA